ALTVNDQGSGVGQTYTLTATTLNRSGAAAITYGAVQGLTVNTASDSIVEVISTAAGTPVTLNGTAGPISLFTGDGDNTWNVTGPNAGTLSGSLITGPVTFSGAQYLHGGNGADTFLLADGAAVDYYIDGGGGLNTLDYSAYTGSVIVNLPLG